MKYILTALFFFSFLLNAQNYVFSGGKGNVAQQIASEILKKAYKRAGLQMEAVFLPLEESLQRSNTGETDGELARIDTISLRYNNLVKIPVELITVEAVAFSTDTSIHIENWNDLRGHKTTIIKGAKFIEDATKNIPRDFVLSFDEAFQNLQSGKTEIIIVPKLAGLNNKKKYLSAKPVSGALESLPLYHFVHKKNSDLIPIITPILKKMKKSGEINYIRQAYLRTLTH